jgi:chromosome segregation ATPase
MHASKDLSGSSADILLRMVDEIAAIENSGSANQLEKLEQLEHDLSLLVEDEKMFKEPRPPTIPPPLDSLGIGLKNNNDRNDVADDEALAKAEQALRKLRQRLKEEEESLRQAEEALARSREEDETLRKAEQTLQRSREEAEKRKAQAIQLTEQAVASANKTREEKQRAERIAQEIHASKKSNNEPSATMAIQKPRATIPLDWLYGKKDVLDENELVNGDASTDSKPPQKMDQAPPGVPILYDWIQYIDGSISGKVKGSKSFKDGSSVSTSPIQVRAVFGSVVTTASGNK